MSGSTAAPQVERSRAVLLGLIVAAALWWGAPKFLSPAMRLLPGVDSFSPEQGLTAFLILRWVTVGLLLAVVLLWERAPLSSLGIRRPTVGDLGWAVVFAIGFRLAGPAFLAGVAVWAYRDHRRRRTDSGPRTRGEFGRDLVWVSVGVLTGIALELLRRQVPVDDAATRTDDLISGLPFLGLLGLLLTAVITEELFYRGYLIERLAAVTGRLWIAGLVSFSAFVVGHIDDVGLANALTGTTLGSAAFTILYVWRRNLPACVVLHLLANSPILLL